MTHELLALYDSIAKFISWWRAWGLFTLHCSNRGVKFTVADIAVLPYQCASHCLRHAPHVTRPARHGRRQLSLFRPLHEKQAERETAKPQTYAWRIPWHTRSLSQNLFGCSLSKPGIAREHNVVESHESVLYLNRVDLGAITPATCDGKKERGPNVQREKERKR